MVLAGAFWYSFRLMHQEAANQNPILQLVGKMKITIWGINYAPEPTGFGPYNTDLCGYLREVGHEVRMVTGFPYYPEWKKGAADEVLRCWQYVPARPNLWRRMFHQASFICSSFCRLLFTPRPDLLIVVSPPLLPGPVAWLAGLLKGCPFHFSPSGYATRRGGFARPAEAGQIDRPPLSNRTLYLQPQPRGKRHHPGHAATLLPQKGPPRETFNQASTQPASRGVPGS